MIHWPTWTPGGNLLTFVDAESDVAASVFNDPEGLAQGVQATPVRGLVLSLDTFRTDAMELLNRLFLKYPF